MHRKPKGKLIYMVAMLCCMLLAVRSKATHLRAADVKVERICGTLTFRITVIAYLNSQSRTRFGTRSDITFGDGFSISIPATDAVLRPDLGTDISVATFTTQHTYASNGVYKITYIERDRSQGVLNIANSQDVPYVTSVTINTDPAYGCNRFPVLVVIPLDRACSGVTFYHNSGAYDPDGDSISYEMTIPASSATTFATYKSPNSSDFYTRYNTGNEAQDGPPVFFINSLTGLITFDAPGMIGEYNIAFKIMEWRKDASGNYKNISTTIRDMQIVVQECKNTRPDIQVPQDTCVVAGTKLNVLIKGTDAENHPVKIEIFSEILLLPEDDSPASYSPVSTSFTSPPALVTFQWSTRCTHVRQQYYQVVFKITDNPPDGPRLVTYKTWRIRVVAPAPVWDNVYLDLEKRNAKLSWNKYTCSQAMTMQIWRKVDSYAYETPYCVTGIPANSGYILIDQIDAQNTSYTDTNFGNGLAEGAKYCYRLMATIADTKSYVSTEFCIGPIKVDAPVITNVSIVKTDTNGEVVISWRSPFDINKEQFPEPYEYEVYRATGYVGNEGLVKIKRTSDTTFTDTGINTADSIFNYRIVLYAKPYRVTSFIPVDTSAIASSVRLEAIAGVKSITLQWRDSVPWSNVVQRRPYHLIYRYEGIGTDADPVLIDSTNVLVNGFSYTDTGQTSRPSLNENQIYTYKIMTRGTYGNTAIALQENFSQIVIVYPVNNLLPCTPSVAIDITDCDNYFNRYACDTKNFSNTLRWSIEGLNGCKIDIKNYNVYASATPGGDYELIATLPGLSYVDKNLTSLARCYKISAINREGIESELSEEVCNDNCPYYELPNVFTPNNDGCNDLFTARYETKNEEGILPCVVLNETSCARFVTSVNITIFNRWGGEVYQFSSNDTNSIFIDWNGQDSHGKDLSTGIYYYTADVTFNTLNPALKMRRYKGWVHLVR